MLRRNPAYRTTRGAAFVGDSLAAMRAMRGNSVDLIVTSPPYALHAPKAYGNVPASKYVKEFLPFADQMLRILKSKGSLVLNVGGSWTPGQPTRTIYTYKLLVALVEETGFHLAQEFFWYNPAKMPVPAEWVTVRRQRVRDSVEFVWWLSKTPWPQANNREVLLPYSRDMLRLKKKGLARTSRPGGYAINSTFATTDAGGSIPPNFIDDVIPSDILRFGNNSSNDRYTKRCKRDGLRVHPARFPPVLPEIFVRFLTQKKDLVVDPFAGSNTTGMVAEALDRRWISIEADADFVEASKRRFDGRQLR